MKQDDSYVIGNAKYCILSLSPRSSATKSDEEPANLDKGEVGSEFAVLPAAFSGEIPTNVCVEEAAAAAMALGTGSDELDIAVDVHGPDAHGTRYV